MPAHTEVTAARVRNWDYIACEMDIPAGAMLSLGQNAKAGREASQGGRKTTKDDQRVSFRPNESRDRQSDVDITHVLRPCF
jgi:hypothetical protein